MKKVQVLLIIENVDEPGLRKRLKNTKRKKEFAEQIKKDGTGSRKHQEVL